MTSTLLSLPSETIIAVAGYLNSAVDYVHLSRTCKSIHRLLDDERATATALKRIAAYSRECQLATSRSFPSRTAFKALYNRQQAFSRARPSSVIVLGEGSSFSYRQGILAYLRGGSIRILDVYNARETEGVLLPELIGPQILDTHCKSTELELCNLQDGFLTFMFYGETQTVGWRSWVLVIDADYVKNGDELTSDRVRLAVDLWTQADVVVRNDRRYICFMSPTGQSVNGRHREWVCKVWDLDDRDSRPMTLQIPDLAVGEIGQTLVFEIFNGYLYAVSTQSPFELDEPGWTSDYTCLRFPLENPHPLTLEKLQIWRRHHNEGPINDLWTDLKLHADEATGKLFIVEARKEWTFGSSVQRRTWHRQALPPLFPFPKDATDNDDQKMANVGNQDANQHQLTAANQPHDLMSSNTSVHDPPYLLVKPPGDDEPDQGLDSAALLNFGLRPGHPRLPHDTHSEYPADAPVPPIVDSFLLANSKYRTYEPSAAAFLDLVVDDRRKPSRQSNWAQQIRLRIGSRRKAPPLNENGMIHEHLINSYSGQPVPDSELRYVDQGIHLWPPVDAPIVLQDLLNGNSQIPTNDMTSNESGYRTLGEITAISDERSIIYLVKKRDASENDQGQLILINFDEHIRFFYKKWVPRFLDLYRHQSLDPQPTEPITIERLLEKEYERIEVDSDELDQGDDEDQEAEEEISDREGEGTIIPADDINDYHWQELYDEDEEPEWIIEEMASWTELRQGFRFV